MKTAVVKFLKLDPKASIPTYAHGYEEDAGMDLYAIEDTELMIGAPVVVKTGLAMQLPAGVEAQIRTRSGLAKHGVVVLNSPATIDPSYRGEVCCILCKVAGPQPYQIHAGDRIAQMVLSEYVGGKPKETKTLTKSKRGKGGFGSTGR